MSLNPVCLNCSSTDHANLYRVPGVCVLGPVLGGGTVTSKQVVASALNSKVHGGRFVNILLHCKLINQQQKC